MEERVIRFRVLCVLEEALGGGVTVTTQTEPESKLMPATNRQEALRGGGRGHRTN